GGTQWGRFGAFAVALLKRVMHRVCLPLAGTVFVVLLCAVGLEGKAQRQSRKPTVTNVNPNTGPTSGGTSVTITGTNFSGATAVSFGGNAAASLTASPRKRTSSQSAPSAAPASRKRARWTSSRDSITRSSAAPGSST